MTDQIDELKKIFEYEIKRKLSERARSSTDEFRILMNGFKFYDYTYSGKVNQTEFVKGILRTGLSGFNESDIRSIFNSYDINKTGYIDYKNFCNYLYGREPLTPLNNSQNETQSASNINDNAQPTEQIIQKQKTPINTVQKQKTPLNNANMNNANNTNISQIPPESQNSVQNENGQKLNQIPPEKNQQNIDPNQTKEYFKKLIISLKDQIHTNNGLTYYSLLFELKNNSDQNQNISLENFLNAFKIIGLNIPQNDIINFFNLLDFSGAGNISIEDIINNILDPISEHRKLYVVNKFALLDVDKQGEVKVSLLKEKYNPKGHPDVISGKTSDVEIFKQFCYTLDIYCNIRNINEIINYKQFIDYYAGISSSIIDEKYFEDILNGVWDIQTDMNEANNNIEQNIHKEQEQIQMNQNTDMNNNINSEINNGRDNNINEQNNRVIKRNKFLESGFSENMGINSIFLGESTHVMPKSFGKKSFKKFKGNFGLQNQNIYNNKNNNFNNDQNPLYQNKERINNIKSNDFAQNNYNRNNYNKTPINQINQSQEIQNNQNPIQKNNYYNVNQARQQRLKFAYNPITNEYVSRDLNNINQTNKTKTPLNNQNNQNIQNNTETTSTNNTNISNNQNSEIQNNEEQIKQIIINALNKLKTTFILRGSHSLFSFQRKLSLYDLNHKGIISFDDFSMIIQAYTMKITPEEIKIIFDLFDKEKTGLINYNELIQTIIGQISQQRKICIQKVFDRFNKDNNGKVSISEIKLLFNSRRHPDVISGKKSEGEIFGEFLDNIENYREYLEHLRGAYENNFTLEDFINFYSIAGMSMDDDNIFEFMMNNCWNLDNSSVGKSNMNNMGGNRYRNNGGYDYRNNNGNLMARAGSQIIGNNRY